MTPRELYDKLLGSYVASGNAMFGPSFYDQGKNANLALDALNKMPDYAVDPVNGITGEQRDRYGSFLKGQRNQAIAGGIMAGLNGLTQIGTAASSIAGINDTTGYDNQIADIRNIGSTDYNSFDQLASDYTRLGDLQPNINYGDIRGMTTGQKVGNVFSSTLSGAVAGNQIGGPVGAAVGGLVGLGAGAAGWLIGDHRAEQEERRLKQNAVLANQDAELNLDTAGERLKEYKFRSGVSHMAKNGGQIERRQETIQEFAERIKKKPRQRGYGGGGCIVRRHCNGGTMIRFKK